VPEPYDGIAACDFEYAIRHLSTLNCGACRNGDFFVQKQTRGLRLACEACQLNVFVRSPPLPVSSTYDVSMQTYTAPGPMTIVVTRPFFDGKWMVLGAESVSHTRRLCMLSCCLHCILDSTLVVFVVAHSKREMEEHE
jgi:hypothetical protein